LSVRGGPPAVAGPPKRAGSGSGLAAARGTRDSISTEGKQRENRDAVPDRLSRAAHEQRASAAPMKANSHVVAGVVNSDVIEHYSFNSSPSFQLVKSALGLSRQEAKAADEIAAAVALAGARDSDSAAAVAAAAATEAASVIPGHPRVGSGGLMTIAATLEIIAGLHTGADAISFFLSFGETSPIKFLHLTRRHALGDKRAPFRPYDLIITPKDDAVKMGVYFTVTPRGVTYFVPGEPVEFSPLAEFLRDAAAFDVCARMTFFRLFLQRKSFKNWRASVNFNRFARSRAATRAALFSWTPTFLTAFETIAGILAAIDRVAVVAATGARYTADALADEQALVRAEASRQWDSQALLVIAAVERVVADITRRAHDGGDTGGAQSGAAAAAAAAVAAAGATKSMAAIKAEFERRAAAQRFAASEETLLPRFIARVDYMLTETIARSIETAFIALATDLSAGELRVGQPGMLLTTVRFRAGGDGSGASAVTVFEPSRREFIDAFDSVINEAVKASALVARVSSAHSLRAAASPRALGGGDMSPHSPNVPSASGLLQQSPRLDAARRAISDRLDVDFAAATTYAAVFDPLRPIFEYALTLDWEAFKASDPSTAVLQREMSRLRACAVAVERMRTSHVAGASLFVDSKGLKAELEPVNVHGLDRLKTLLIDSTRAKCRTAGDAFLSRARQLSGQPATLEKFASFVERRNALRDSEASLLKQLAAVEDLYKLIAAYDVRLNSEDSVALDDIRNAHSAYADAQRSASQYIEDRLPDFSRQLDSNVLRANESLTLLGESVNHGVFVSAASPLQETITELQGAAGRLGSLKTMCESYSQWSILFGSASEIKENKHLKDAQKAVDTRLALWKGLASWETKHNNWLTCPFGTLDVEELVRDVQQAVKGAYAADKVLSDEVSGMYKARVVAFRAYSAVIADLGNKSMRERHWKRLYEDRKIEPRTDNGAGRTLAELVDMKVADVPDLCAEMSGIASGEAQLEAQLAKIETAWAITNFTTKNYREQRGVYILAGLDDIIMQLEDHQVTLQTMLGSRFIAGVREAVEMWDRRLGLLSETQDEWLTCQRQWMYLETIFSAEDIQRQLPVEAQKFFGVDRQWKDIMAKTAARPLVLYAVEQGDKYLEIFKASNIVLEQIQKALEDYLETKRSGFPRFYFLSNDELLAILAQSRDPTAVQPHMQKCFDAVKSITFERGPHPDDPSMSVDIIVAMNSPEGESVRLTQGVPTLGNVEEWMTAFEKEMRISLRSWSNTVVKAYPDYETAVDRAAWYWSGPAQCIIGVDIVFWTRNCQEAIRKATAAGTDATVELKAFLEYSVKQLNNMVILVRGDLSKLQRVLLGALTVIDVHARDVVGNMIAKKVTAMEDFEWTKQLRYYWEIDKKEDDIVVRQCNTRFPSGHEYLGNSERLVITPLTDQW
jgi:dynein heavy chain